MVRFSILFAAGLSVTLSHAPAKLQPVPFNHLPKEVSAGLADTMADACGARPKAARKEARFAHVFRADLDGDGINDYVMDEWSARCFRNPAHYIHVWKGTGADHYKHEEHADASLVRGAQGFAWVQKRCDRSDNADFQIETYQNGKIDRSRCFPAKELGMELQARGLTDAFPARRLVVR
jgi:hypothetical protein